MEPGFNHASHWLHIRLPFHLWNITIRQIDLQAGGTGQRMGFQLKNVLMSFENS